LSRAEPSPIMAPARRRVTVASYNIHQCVGVDRQRDPRRTAEVIQSLGAEVIALQEVDSWPGGATDPVQMEFLAHTVGLEAISGPTLERRGGHYGNALLTRLPILEVRKLDLTVWKREPRGALDVDLDAHGSVLRVIATHLGLLASERRVQVRRLLDALGDDHADVTVLLGDMNEWFGVGRPLRWLHAHFGRGPSVRSYPSWWPLFALDRVWVQPYGALERFAVHAGGAAGRASDHLPVTAEILLPATRSGLPGANPDLR
jgi:endonuclease/exonuclease/phosphatase family metal-dependent hydrolase